MGTSPPWARGSGLGASVDVLGVDGELKADELDGTTASRSEDVDMLYVAAHGELRSRSHAVVLHDSEWTVTAGGLGSRAPGVAVFDTCHLVDVTDPQWPDPWLAGQVGPHLRLVLGSASLATVDRRSTERGEVFVSELNQGAAIADAWLTAVHTTSTSRRDVGVSASTITIKRTSRSMGDRRAPELTRRRVPGPLDRREQRRIDQQPIQRRQIGRQLARTSTSNPRSNSDST